MGKKYGQLLNGLCPEHAQSPQGKELNISFIGPEPFITYDPIGGSDFLVIKILAEKFNFIPKFIAEKSMDMVVSNGTSHGMVYKVRRPFCSFYTLKDFNYRLQLKKVRWELDNYILIQY